MGIYTTAELRYGIFIPEDDVERLEGLENGMYEELYGDLEDTELAYAAFGDSQWDTCESVHAVVLQEVGSSAGEGIALRIDPRADLPDVPEHDRDAARTACEALGLTWEPHWFLAWDRG